MPVQPGPQELSRPVIDLRQPLNKPLVIELPLYDVQNKALKDLAELNTEIEDASRMDGASESSVFFGVCIPQVKAGLAATSVFALILTWNEFLFSLLLTNKLTRTMPPAMARTIGGEINVDYGLLAAMICLFIIPIFLITYLLQNQLLRGVTFGTIKK